VVQVRHPASSLALVGLVTVMLCPLRDLARSVTPPG
jgi:hypothetical protein